MDEVFVDGFGQFAGKGADGDLAGATGGAGHAGGIFLGKVAAGLVLEPVPGGFDHEGAQPGAAVDHADAFPDGAAGAVAGGEAEEFAEGFVAAEEAGVDAGPVDYAGGVDAESAELADGIGWGRLV